MRICFLAEANSAHIEKWCRYFLEQGHEVHVISFTKGEIPGAEIHWIDLGLDGNEGDLAKLKYLTQAGKVRRLVKKIRPDVVNVHYATSYGAVAALSGIWGYVLSVWGSDIYDFPKKSILHRALLRFSLKRAGILFSTSRAMARETRKYTRKSIRITPFGVDTSFFTPKRRKRLPEYVDGRFMIGLVKKLEPKYGIDVLLRAAAVFREKRPNVNLRLMIAGTGTHEEEYKKLAEELGIAERVTWTGFIPAEEAANLWANLDVAVIPSVLDSESFGVSAVEAEASGVPVIVSDVPGLTEATRPGYTALTVKRQDPEALAEALVQMYDDPVLRGRLGLNGRKYVQKRYEYRDCFRQIEQYLTDWIERGKKL